MQERHKVGRTLGISETKQMSGPPWAQLQAGKCGRGSTEAKGIPLMNIQRALESSAWGRFSRSLN